MTAKKQHFVPQSYLNRFSCNYKDNPKDKKYYIWVFDKESKKPREVKINIGNIAQDKYFYDISKCSDLRDSDGNLIYEMKDGSGNLIDLEQQDCLEKKFFVCDAKYNIILDEIISKIDYNVRRSNHEEISTLMIVINDEAKPDLSAMIYFQLSRTRKFRKDLEKELEKIKALSPELFSQEPEDWIQNNLPLCHADFFLDANAIQKFSRWLTDQIWLIGINETGQEFFTSDHPIVFDDNQKK